MDGTLPARRLYSKSQRQLSAEQSQTPHKALQPTADDRFINHISCAAGSIADSAMETARSVRGSDWYASMDAEHGRGAPEEVTPQPSFDAYGNPLANSGTAAAAGGYGGNGGATMQAGSGVGRGYDGVIDIRVDTHRASGDGGGSLSSSTPSSMQVRWDAC